MTAPFAASVASPPPRGTHQVSFAERRKIPSSCSTLSFAMGLSRFTWIAIAFVVAALLIWGNQEAWAMMALGYLIGSRVAFLVDGLHRLRD